MGDDGAEDRTLVVLGDAADDNAVGAGRVSVVDAAGVGYGEFKVWLLSVGEAEMLVVVVDVRVCSSSQRLYRLPAARSTRTLVLAYHHISEGSNSLMILTSTHPRSDLAKRAAEPWWQQR